MNIVLNLHILIMTWRFAYTLKSDRWNLKQLFIYNKAEGTVN